MSGDRPPKRVTLKEAVQVVSVGVLIPTWAFGGVLLREMTLEKQSFDEAVGAAATGAAIVVVALAAVGLMSVLPDWAPRDSPPRPVQTNERADRINAELTVLRAELQRTRDQSRRV